MSPRQQSANKIRDYGRLDAESVGAVAMTGLDQLLANARLGDVAALDLLVARLSEHLWAEYGGRARPRGLGPSRGMSDLIQEALLGVQGEFTSFQGQSFAEFRQWARTFLYHRRLHWSRNYRLRNEEQRKRKIWLVTCDRLESGPLGAAPHELAVLHEQCERAFAAFGRLRPNDQFVIRMRLFEGLRPKEIAHVTRSNVEAVRRAYQRAIERLKEAFLSDDRR